MPILGGAASDAVAGGSSGPSPPRVQADVPSARSPSGGTQPVFGDSPRPPLSGPAAVGEVSGRRREASPTNWSERQEASDRELLRVCLEGFEGQGDTESLGEVLIDLDDEALSDILDLGALSDDEVQSWLATLDG